VERCPACRARVQNVAVCHRCGADLELLVRAEHQVKRWIREAVLSYESGDRDTALDRLRKIDALDAGEATHRVTGFLKEKLGRPLVRWIGPRDSDPRIDELRRAITDCAHQVHRTLGEGLALPAYEDCLSREMSLRDLNFTRDHPVPVSYKGLKLRDCARINHLVEGKIAVVLCPASREINRYERRCANWIRLGEWPGGLLIDFDAD
jgi:GxxExxY protein